MDPEGQRLAFIVGHYKSGSSWLAYLLCLHPAIRGLAETHIFRHSEGGDLTRCTKHLYSTVAWAGGGRRRLLHNRLAAWARPLRRSGQSTLSWKDRPTTLLDLSIRDQLRLRRTLLSNSDVDPYRVAFFQYLCKALRPPVYLLEKTPTNIFYVPEIRGLFPGCKLVAIYRDGRDVVVSDRFHWQNAYQKNREFCDSVTDWSQAMRAQLHFAEAYDIYLLTYEELLHDGSATVGRLLRFLELDDDPAIVSEMLYRSSFEFITGRKPGTEKQESFFRKGVAGDWTTHLSSDECRIFSEIAGEMLVTLGYEESAEPETWQGERR